MVFNEHASAFFCSKQSVDKGGGNRLYLSADKTYLDIIYATGSKISILQNQNYAFDSGNGTPFMTMEALYDKLVLFMEDREGGNI
jgi:hypothetical protein